MQKWTKIDEKLVYDGYRKIIRKTVALPDGSSADFDTVKSNVGAAILALTEDDKVVCFKQFRPGPEEILYELPGGGIEEKETPIVAIRRELLEETGYEADIEYLGSHCRDAYVTGMWHMVVGRNARKIHEPQLEATEFGDLLLLDVDEFKEKLYAGLMSDTTLGYAGLHHFELL
jgi:ADP-ribose pyrophosphatase